MTQRKRQCCFETEVNGTTHHLLERDTAHLCMRFSITVRMRNGHVAFYSYHIAALVATGSSALDEKAQCSLGEQYQRGTVQQENRPCSNAADHQHVCDRPGLLRNT